MVVLLLALLVAAPPSREDARKALRRAGCQTCHDSEVSVQHTDALEQFDLHDPNWSDGMSAHQLPKLLTRLKSSPADSKVVQAFIEAELAARLAKGKPDAP